MTTRRNGYVIPAYAGMTGRYACPVPGREIRRRRVIG